MRACSPPPRRRRPAARAAPIPVLGRVRAIVALLAALAGASAVPAPALAAWPAPDAPPVAEIALVTARPLQHHAVAFSAASSRDDATIGVFPWNLTYAWDFGDGSVSTDPAPTHVYADPGTYVVLLAVTDAGGSTDTVTRSVLVSADRPPRVNWSPSTSKLVTGSPATFTAGVSDDGAVTPTCVWDFGDGGSAASCTATHAFGVAGAYDVTVTATDDAGEVTALAKTVTVRSNAPPTVAIVPSTGRPTTGHALTLTGSGWDDSKIASWAWDLGDGTTAATQNVTNKVYATPGLTEVTLVATDDSGATSSATMTLLVTEDRAPRVDIAVSTARPFAGHSLTFTGGGWDETKVAAWAWDFGDGTISTKQSPAKTYASAGAYPVSLTVTDDTGHAVTATRDVMVAPDQLPRAAFGASSAHPAAGANVTLTNGSVDDASGLVYLWDFGDGTTSTTTSPVKAWADPGTYTITLTATDDAGHAVTVTHDLVVGGSVTDVVPLVDFKQNTARPIAGATSVTFSTSGYVRDNASGLHYAWSFGDGGTSTASSPAYTFAVAGDYTVTLTVTDSTGHTASRTEAVHVDPNMAPYAYLSVSPGGTPLTGQLVTLSAASSKNDDSGTVTYTFSEDGVVLQSGTATSLKRTYTTPGERIITVEVRDPKGIVSTVTRLVPVDDNQAPLAYASLSPGMSLLPGQTVTASASSSRTDDGGALTYTWSVDGVVVQSGTTKTLARTFTEPGEHVVSLVVTDPFGLASAPLEEGIVVRADLAPLVNFSGGGSTRPLVGDTTTLTASVRNDESAAVSYAWTVDGDVVQTGTTKTLPFTYAAAGAHTVTVVATDAGGHASQPMTRTFSAEDDGAPTPTFTAPARVWSDETVTVDATGSVNDDAGALACSWDWGDGTGGSGCTATHLYGGGGTYPITLTLRDAAGHAASDTRPVLVDQVPVARFSVPHGFVGHPATFDAGASDAPADSTFSWQFGDGQIATGAHVPHTFDADGTYQVTLEITDQYGHASSVTHAVDVSTDPRPIAAFDAPAAAPLARDAVHFDGRASSDGGAIVAYRWDFGDGVSATGSQVTHAYDAAGVYDVALEIEDDAGLTDRLVRSVRVDDPPTAVLHAPAEAFAGRPVALDATASTDAHGLAGWSWNFGDGAAGSGAATGHVYPAAGTYELTLTVTDDDGHTDRRTAVIRISPDLAVTGLDADPVTRVAPALSWTVASGVSADRFRVYRDGAAIATSLDPDYVDASGLADGDYQYAVTTLLASGDEGTPSAPVTVRIDRTPPPPPADLAAVTPTAAAPDLTWSAADDAGSGIATYVLFRDGVEIGRTATAGYVDDDVAEDGTYAYTVLAVDGAGNVGAATAAVTVEIDTHPPGAPAGVVGPSPTATVPALTWTPVAETSEYRVYRGGVPAATTTDPAFVDTGVAEGRYTYTISAVDAIGNESAPSSPHTVVYDATPPSTPQPPTAVSPTASPITLTWPAAVDDNGVDVYEVLRDGALVGSVRTRSFTDETASEGSHAYALRAVDGAGNPSGTSSALTAVYDTTPPTAPTALTGPSQTRLKPVFSWTASTDAVSGVVGYRVYRGATLLGTTVATSFTDAGVSAGGTYRYVVRALDAAGNSSAASDDLSVVYDTTPPTAPSTPSAASPTRTPPVITWSGGADANGIDHYVVVRDGVDIGIAASPWRDADPLAEGPHTYAVRAVDPAGNVSSPGPSRTVTYDTTAPTAPSVSAASPTAGAPALTWTGATDAVGVVRYEIARDGAPLGSTAGTALTDATAAEGTHAYTVQAFDAAGNAGPLSDPFAVVVDRTAPPVPDAPVGPAITDQTVTLAWTPVDDPGSGVAYYVVRRDGAVVGTPSTPAFADGGVTTDGAYAYDISAVDGAGNTGGRSDPRTVVFDIASPDTSLPSPPALTGPDTEIELAASEPDTTFECRLDGGAYAACGSPVPLTGLTDGLHTLEVRAIDAAGNVDSTPALHQWTVDATPPAPPGLIATADATLAPGCRCASVTLQVSASGDAVRVRVTRPGRTLLDGAAADVVDADVADGSSVTYTAVAYDALGNASTAATTDVSTPDRTPPDAPAAPTGSGSPLTVTWAAVTGATSYLRRRDGAPLPTSAVSGDADADAVDSEAPDAPTAVTTAPTSGTTAHIAWAAAADRGSDYAYAVAALDAAGNPSGWSPESALTATAGTDRYRVLVDGTQVAEVATPSADLTDLASGTTHAVTIIAVDAAGNASSPSAAVPLSLPDGGAVTAVASVRPSPFARPGAPLAFHAATGGVPPVALRWSFDDGASATGADVSHGFAATGRHVASVTATTAAGRKATAAVQVVVDGKAPQTRASVRGARLIVDATDDLSGVAAVTVALRAGAGFTRVPATGLPLGDGRYALRIRALDRAGNVRETSLAALVDTHPPTLRVTPLGRRGRQIRMRITASDAVSGVSLVLLDRRPLRSTVVLLRPGTQHKLVATDARGNTTRVTFRVPTSSRARLRR